MILSCVNITEVFYNRTPTGLDLPEVWEHFVTLEWPPLTPVENELNIVTPLCLISIRN